MLVVSRLLEPGVVVRDGNHEEVCMTVVHEGDDEHGG